MNLSIHKFNTTKNQKHIIYVLFLVLGLEVSLYFSNSFTKFPKILSIQKQVRKSILTVFSNAKSAKSTTNIQTSEKLQNSPFATDLEPIYAAPVRMYIRKSEVLPKESSEGALPEEILVANKQATSKQNSEKIIDFNLIDIGVEPDGKLEVPKNWDEGGWYVKSAYPGEKGNLIINAHYDTNTGAPGALYNLKNVKINDRVYVVDQLGRTFAYEVTDLFEIDIQDPNRLKIFDSKKDKSELTLITCGGVWNYKSGYNKRLVVKAGR